jgi:dipeptidyl aminopeptidase/acylaminoacyl peptidase
MSEPGVRAQADERAPLTFDAHLTLRRPSEAVLAADGRRIAWALPEALCIDRDAGAQSRVWTLDIGGEPRQLTSESGFETLPRWSPTGDRLAFASDCGHRGRLSLRLQHATSGSTEFAVPGSVEDIVWSPDGRKLMVLAADIGSDRAGSHQATRIVEFGSAEADPRVTRPRRVWRRLFVVDVERGTIDEVGPQGWTVWEFDWRGGALVAAVVSEDPSEGGWYDASVVIFDTDDRTMVSEYTPRWQVAMPKLSPDSSMVAFVEGLASDRSDLAAPVLSAQIEPGPLAPTILAESVDVSWLVWLDDGRLAFAGWKGLGTTCGFIERDGSLEEVWSGAATIGARLTARIDCDSSGNTLVAVYEASNEPPEIATLNAGSKEGWAVLTDFNSHLRDFDLPVWSEYRWHAPDGTEIDGLLALPSNVGAEELPLVVLVHGGPTTSWSHAWISDIPRLPMLWTSSGYAVLLPNPRGSRGYGQEFARANLGDMGGADLVDIIAGVDKLVADGVVATNRVGITGNSYGGFIAAMAIGKTDRFAASIPMAVISNWRSYHNTANIGAFDELFLAADPYEPGGPYHERSPVVWARNVQTPTLIMQGELDLCTPVGQAQELYQAIAETGRAEVELVVFPREGHAYVECGHQREIWRRSKEWFDRHLRDQTAPRA